jgi:hypothetical protein
MDTMMIAQLAAAGANLAGSIMDKTGKKKNQPLQAGVEFNTTPQDADLAPLMAGLEGGDDQIFSELFKNFMGKKKADTPQFQMPYQMPQLAPLPSFQVQASPIGPPPVPTYNRRR